MKTNTESAKSTTHTLALGAKRFTYMITGDSAVVIDEIVYSHPTKGAMVAFGSDTYRMTTAEARKSWARRVKWGFKPID
jgi:hypothetical protein